MTRRTEPRKVVGGTPRAVREASRETAARSPPGEDAALAGEIVRLTNRTAALTFAAAFVGIAALVAVGRAFSGGTTVFVRLAAAVLGAAAVVTVVAVWRSRVRLRAARGRADAERGRGQRA